MKTPLERVKEYDEGLYKEISKHVGCCPKCGKWFIKEHPLQKYDTPSCANAYRVRKYRLRKKSVVK